MFLWCLFAFLFFYIFRYHSVFICAGNFFRWCPNSGLVAFVCVNTCNENVTSIFFWTSRRFFFFVRFNFRGNALSPCFISIRLSTERKHNFIFLEIMMLFYMLNVWRWWKWGIRHFVFQPPCDNKWTHFWVRVERYTQRFPRNMSSIRDQLLFFPMSFSRAFFNIIRCLFFPNALFFEGFANTNKSTLIWNAVRYCLEPLYCCSFRLFAAEQFSSFQAFFFLVSIRRALSFLIRLHHFKSVEFPSTLIFINKISFLFLFRR